MSELKRLADLLEQTLKVVKEDRVICKRQVKRFEDQLTRVTGLRDGHIVDSDEEESLEMEMSQEGHIEKELNKAVRNLLVSSMRFDAIINALGKVREAEIKSDAKIKATEILVDSQLPYNRRKKYVSGPADFKQLKDEIDITEEAIAKEAENPTN